MLEYPPEVAKHYSKALQARLAYKISSPNAGMVDMRDPGFLLEDDFDMDAPIPDLDKCDDDVEVQESMPVSRAVAVTA